MINDCDIQKRDHRLSDTGSRITGVCNETGEGISR
jgi:hypothetical protein